MNEAQSGGITRAEALGICAALKELVEQGPLVSDSLKARALVLTSVLRRELRLGADAASKLVEIGVWFSIFFSKACDDWNAEYLASLLNIDLASLQQSIRTQMT